MKRANLIAIAAISTAYAGDDDLYWQLQRIESAIQQQTDEEGFRYRQWRRDQWYAEQEAERAQQQWQRDHSLDWLDHYINQ